MDSKWHMLIIVWVFSPLSLSCAHTINSVTIYRHPSESLKKIEWKIDNPILANSVKIQSVKELRKGNLYYVAVQLKNTWYKPISAKLRVEFYDNNGVALENPWGWHPIIIEANQDAWFEFMAPKPLDEIGAVKVMIRDMGSVPSP